MDNLMKALLCVQQLTKKGRQAVEQNSIGYSSEDLICYEINLGDILILP